MASRQHDRSGVAATFGIALAAAVLAVPSAASASVFGSLSNFDVVNDTGKHAYGFEIEIEDSSFDSSHIYSVFGLNRVFSNVSPDPTYVNRFGAYGAPVIQDVPGFGVRITYGGVIGSTFTPGIPYSGSPHDSCWPGADPNWKDKSCDHFGVSTIGSPAKTTYSWLVETSPGSGVLTKQQTGIPAVAISYTPPVPGVMDAVVNAIIEAVAENDDDPDNPMLWGEPYWMKIFTTNVEHEIDLGDLLRGDEDQEAAEVEIEWTIFQKAPVGEDGPNDMQEGNVMLADGDEAVIRRYEFYKGTSKNVAIQLDADRIAHLGSMTWRC